MTRAFEATDDADAREVGQRRLFFFALALALALTIIAALMVRRAHTLTLKLSNRSGETVIFVVMDAVRADRTSLCGYQRPTTPTLEGLESLGASVACDAHTPSSWTLPSHASFFTGRDSSVHGAGSGGGPTRMPWGGVTPLDDSLETLAESFSARGYQTALLSGNPVVNADLGLTRGFDHVYVASSYRATHDEQLAARLDDLLGRLDPDRPLFLFINIADAHSPWTEIPDGHAFLPPRPALKAQPGRRRYERGEFDEEQREAYLAQLSDVYDHAVERADRSLDRVLTALREERWLAGDYRLIITSDHGEYLGEHQLVEHGRPFFYEPVTRVPLVFYSTRRPLTLPEDEPAIAAYSLALKGALPDDPTRFASAAFRSRGADRGPCEHTAAALWTKTHKYYAKGGRVLRFDRSRDPAELHPVTARRGPEVSRLREYCDALDARFQARNPVEPERAKRARERLEGLGYL